MMRRLVGGIVATTVFATGCASAQTNGYIDSAVTVIAKEGIFGFQGTGKISIGKEVSEDQYHDALDEIQKLTDEHTKKIDDLLAHKEQEVMEV